MNKVKNYYLKSSSALLRISHWLRYSVSSQEVCDRSQNGDHFFAFSKCYIICFRYSWVIFDSGVALVTFARVYKLRANNVIAKYWKNVKKRLKHFPNFRRESSCTTAANTIDAPFTWWLGSLLIMLTKPQSIPFFWSAICKSTIKNVLYSKENYSFRKKAPMYLSGPEKSQKRTRKSSLVEHPI